MGRTEGSGSAASSETTSTISLAALEGALEGSAGAEVETEDSDSGAHETLPPGSALLVVKRGPNAGSRFLLDADVTTAGRHPDSDIFLDDVTVSRRHAEFARESGGGGGFLVRDVGSLNGTYLNRQRIESGGLAHGDEVQIGKYRLMFLTGRHDGVEGS
jgi:pSer/pThr/pTyr-binding forkhead associated (FHA) protein